MTPLALCLLLAVQTPAPPDPPVSLAHLPAEQFAQEQWDRWRRHRAELVRAAHFWGWCDGYWQRGIDRCDHACAYWRLVCCVWTSAQGSAGERATLWALADLEGPWWGAHPPPILPEPWREMPPAEDAPNNAAGP